MPGSAKAPPERAPHSEEPPERAPRSEEAGEAPAWAAGLAEEGLDVLAPVTAAAYDAVAPPSLQSRRLLPGARGAWLIGATSRLFERAGGGAALGLDAHTERALARLEAELNAAGQRAVVVLGHRAAPDGVPDLVELGRVAGLGWPSRLGLLLHPRLGPWWSLRAVLLTAREVVPGEALPGLGPCDGCPAPCTTACPAGAPGPDGFDLRACAGVRAQGGPCLSTCAARSACPVGAEHAYPEPALRHIMETSLEPLLAWARATGK